MFYDPKKISNLCPGEKQIAVMEEAVQHMSERRQRRFAAFKLQVEKYWRLYPWLMVCVCVCIFTGCAQTKYVIPNDTITTTDRYHGYHERDSIYLHDSIYVREYIQGDTVFRDKLVEHFKDRWLTRTDTITQRDTTTIYQPVEVIKEVKHVPGFYKWCTLFFWMLIILFLGYLIFRIMKAVYLHK